MLLIKLFIIEGHWNIGKLEGAAKLLSKDPNQESQAHNSNKFIQISKKKKRKWPQCVYTNWINMFCVTLSLIELIFLRSFSMPDLTTCERIKDNFCHRYWILDESYLETATYSIRRAGEGSRLIKSEWKAKTSATQSIQTLRSTKNTLICGDVYPFISSIAIDNIC